MYFVRLELRENLKRQLNNMDQDISSTGEEDKLVEILEEQLGPDNPE